MALPPPDSDREAVVAAIREAVRTTAEASKPIMTIGYHAAPRHHYAAPTVIASETPQFTLPPNTCFATGQVIRLMNWHARERPCHVNRNSMWFTATRQQIDDSLLLVFRGEYLPPASNHGDGDVFFHTLSDEVFQKQEGVWRKATIADPAVAPKPSSPEPEPVQAQPKKEPPPVVNWGSWA